MIRLFRKQQNKAVLVAEDGFTAARSGEELIAQAYLQPYLHDIRALVALPPPHFFQLYLSPITRYLELTQHCQRTAVEQHLQAIIDGLKRRRALLLPPGVTPEVISHQKDLWTYVVFVLLLLRNAADKISAYALMVKKPEEQEHQARQWCPFDKPLMPPYRFKVVSRLPVSPYANLALLPRVLESDGLAWLYRDREAINTVFNLLASPDTNSPLGVLLQRTAKALSKPKPPDKNNAVKPITNKPLETSKKVQAKPCTQALGQQFQDWLTQLLQQADSCEVVTQTSEGLALLCPDIFRRFLIDCADSSHSGNWKAVQAAFLALKRHQVNSITQKAFHQSQWPGRGTCQVIIVPILEKNHQD